MAEKGDARAIEQARARLDSIMRMVKRLQHAEECDGGEACELPDEEIIVGLDTVYRAGAKATDEERARYHDRDEARQTVEEDPLEVSVRSGWHAPGEPAVSSDYLILLCTGGPAVRITGELDEHQQPETAELQYQDWFTAWRPYLDMTDEVTEALLAYARQFYFGE